MSMKLTGKTALVTGASSGFGRHFATTLAANGAHVVLAARRLDALESLAEDIRAKGEKATAIELDVSSAAAVDAAVGSLPSLDVVVNNAGIAAMGRSVDSDEAEWRRILGVNLDGVWFVARAAARKMTALGHPGSIINIASITGLRPAAFSMSYSVSKAAVIQMTKSLAGEWARHGIRVNAIAPGYFETDLNRHYLVSEQGQAMLKRIPQRRFGDMTDLDGPLLLLATKASAYMTGSVLEVDGGHLVSPL